MLRIGAVQRYHGPLAAGIHDLQELSKTHEAVSKAKTEVLHRILTHYLPLYFPEIDRFRHNSRYVVGSRDGPPPSCRRFRVEPGL